VKNGVVGAVTGSGDVAKATADTVSTVFPIALENAQARSSTKKGRVAGMHRKPVGPSMMVLMASLLFILAPVAWSSEPAAGNPSEKPKDCDMTYTLKGWSAVYKTAKGEGTITCNNGDSARVEISVKGGGLTFGKTDIYKGKAEISGVQSIKDAYGSYVMASAHAGVVKAGAVAVMTKGNVSIALAGAGEGLDVGIDFSDFTIRRASAAASK
jgi:hypothetical protein